MRPHSLIIAALIAWATPANAQDSITIASWGGVYEAAQRQALFDPFTTATGIEVKTVTHNGGLDALRTRADAENWSLVDMVEDQAITACDEGLLAEIESERVTIPHENTPVTEDFIPGAFRPCSVAQNVYATVFAYDDRAFLGEKPDSIHDFFDLKRFPGKRAVHRDPDTILEWALMAEGVPIGQVYDLLSTDRGLRLAFRKLDGLKGSILWWTDVGEPPDMLRDGRAVMASGYNGRFFAAAQQESVPLTIVWDGHVISTDVWAIPQSVPDRDAAERFLRFATAPARMAALAELIPYGPTRRSALSRIGLHSQSGIPMRDHLPNAPRHDARALYGENLWYARTRALRTRRFEAWLKGEE